MDRFGSQWRSEVSDAQEYVGLNLAGVEQTNNQWQQVTALKDAGDIDNKPMVDAVKRTLTAEQDESVRSLLEEAENVPYADMPEYITQQEARTAELQAQLEQARQQQSESESRLLEQRQILEKIAPTAKAALDSISRIEVEKIKLAEIESLEASYQQADRDLAAAYELFEKTGQAWPLPRLADVHYEPADDEIFTVDQFPYEREAAGKCIVEGVKRKHESRLSDASAYLALLLKEKPGHIWTSEELGQAIYDDGDDSKRNSARVNALISNYRNGVVPVMAEEIGDELILQRGKRQSFDSKTGKPITRSIRVVWRLVDHDTAIASQPVTTLSSDRTTRHTYAKWELPADIESSPVATQDQTESAAPADESAPSQDDSEVESGKPDWREGFTDSAHAIVEALKDLDLMRGSMSWSHLRMHSSSGVAGTKTARERALKAKIIKKNQMDDTSEIELPQIIMSLMVNTHQDVFRIASRRREATAIIQEIVDGYMRLHSE